MSLSRWLEVLQVYIGLAPLAILLIAYSWAAAETTWLPGVTATTSKLHWGAVIYGSFLSLLEMVGPAMLRAWEMYKNRIGQARIEELENVLEADDPQKAAREKLQRLKNGKRPKVRIQPEYKDDREWVRNDVLLSQKSVGETMDREGNTWFWCQTWAYSNDQVLDPIFAFVETIPSPTLEHFRGDYKDLGEMLFQRGRDIAERALDDDLTQKPPWNGGEIHHRVVVPLSELKEPPRPLTDYGFRKL